MIILGLNAFHGDSSAVIVRDGVLVAAAEEERFRRIKHWAGFPSEAISYCILEAGVTLADVDHIAVNQDSGANLLRKAGYILTQRPDLGLVLGRLKNRQARTGISDLLKQAVPGQSFRGSLHQVEHHLAHLASAFYVSPFEEAVAVSVDGFGDFASAAWGVGRDHEIAVEDRVYFPHSLGIFYQALTQYLGFPHYGDEYKVMGLSPYGEPRFLDDMRRLVSLKSDGTFELGLEYFRHHREKIDYEWSGGAPVVGRLFSEALEGSLGPARKGDEELTQRHRDIARSVQAMYEEAFFHLLNALHAKYGEDHLALAGGCAMNSVANGKVRRMTPFERVYIQPAAGDAGGALGAACVVWQKITSERPRFVMDHAYWGPAFGPDRIAGEIDGHRDALRHRGCTVDRIDDEDDLCRRTARAIADGKVVGWFQGRMEWGPRALGNRSILCDPRRADMKDILNRKIKRRESFRPFAPSILREAVADWFEDDDDVPFMMMVFQVRAERQAEIRAVTHVDGSGRLHTVDEHANPRYHRLIESFRDLTGVPLVLNTSFNENEPVVCTPKEALNGFLRSEMDILVLGDFFIERSDEVPPA